VHFVTSEQVEAYLRSVLFRFDCPSTLTIGHYALELFVDPERRLVAEHLLDCTPCAGELQILRQFLSSEPQPRPHPFSRVFAKLALPVSQLALSPLRGDARQSSTEYDAGPVHIVLGPLPAGRRGTLALDGLLLHDTSPDAVADCDVTLIATDLPVYATQTDDLGNFAFDAIAPGTYQLEIRIDDRDVVVPNLTFGN
jgi:hypothetical protein